MDYRGGSTGDFEADTAITVTQFMLSPDIPPTEKVHFEKFYLMFSKIMALGNIERRDVFSIFIAFDEICMLLEMGLYDVARQMMGKELMKIQVSRSIGGFQILYGQGGIQKTEHIERIMSRRGRKSFSSRIAGAFRGGKSDESEWEDIRR